MLQYFIKRSHCWIVEESDHLGVVGQPVVGGVAGGAPRVPDLGESHAWQTSKLSLSLPESSNTQTDGLQPSQVRSQHSPHHLPQVLLVPPPPGHRHYLTEKVHQQLRSETLLS